MQNETIRRGTTTRKKILYVLYLFFIVFFSLEILLRIYNPFHFRIKGNRIVLPVNERLIIRNDINPRLDPVITNSRNSLGFRGPEKPPHFEHVLSVITVGGSTTECHFLSDDKTWPYLLGERLRRYSPGIWLNNAGFDGHSTFGHQVLLNDYLVKIRPKVILFLTGINDVENEGFTFHDKQNVQGAFNDFKHFIFNNSEVLNLGMNLVRGGRAAKMNNTTSRLLDLRGRKHITMTAEALLARKQAQLTFLAGYRQRLAQLIDTCRLYGIRPVFMTQPDLFGKGRDSITGVNLETLEVQKGINGKGAWEVLELYNEALKQVCTEKKAAVIDLAGQLPKNSLYFYDASHYTNEGAEKVAEIAAAGLTDILNLAGK